MHVKSFLTTIFILFHFILFSQNLETVIQKGHDQRVLAVAVSPDSNYVATGSRDRSVKLWELSTGREVRNFLGHDGSINGIAFSTDGKFILTSCSDMTAKIWEVETGKNIFTTEPTTKLLTEVAISPDMKYFVVAGYNDEANVYSWGTKKIITKLKVNADQGLGYGVHLSFSSDSKWLAVGEDNYTATIYNTTNWEKVNVFNKEEGWCGGCATWATFSKDNKSVIMGSNKGPVKKYDLATNKLITQYTDKIEELAGLQFSKDEKQIIAITKEEITFWDNATGKEIERIKTNLNTEVNDACLSVNGSKILMACDNNVTVVWDIKSKKIESTLTGILNERDKGNINYDANNYWESHIAKYIRLKNSLLLTNDGKSLIKGKFGTKIKRWDVASGQTEMEYVGHEKAALCYVLTKDGKQMISGGGDGNIIIWNVESGDSLFSIKAHREPIFDIQLSSDETKILTGSWDGTMKIHDLKSGKRISYIDLENASAFSLLFSTNDLYVFAAQLGKSLSMREIDTKEIVREFVGHTDVVSSIRLNNDGSKLLSTSWDGSIRLWNVSTGLMDKKFSGHQGAVHVAIFDQSNQHIFSGGIDRAVRMWDVNTSKVIKTFDGHQAEVTSILLSKDGKMLITHATDGVTKFWDLETGKEFFEQIQIGERDWMAKTPDGYFTGTDGARKSIHYVSGMKTYSVDQFFNEYYRPELLPTLFKNRGESKSNPGLQGKLKSSPPPTIKVATVPNTDPMLVDVYVKMTNNGSGVSNVKLFHNGKNIPIDRTKLETPTKKGASTVYKQTIGLVGGTNTFSASASNEDNIESDPQSIEVFADHSAKSSTCYILSVGINTYKNPKMSLNYAKPDAESFGEMMHDKGTALFKSMEIHTLYNEDASREKILSKLEELAGKVGTNDVFIFYYAGHGSMVDNQFYFVPSEGSRLYDAKALQKEAIEASVLQDKFKNILALKQLIIMDACQSGGSVELLATRGAAEEKAIAQLSRSAGIHVMASAGSEQFATEFEQLGHGLFTYVLIEALQGAADGAPKDGKVTIYELKSYLDDQMPEMTRKLKGKPQYPYTFSRGHDFPLVIENK